MAKRGGINRFYKGLTWPMADGRWRVTVPQFPGFEAVSEGARLVDVGARADDGLSEHVAAMLERGEDIGMPNETVFTVALEAAQRLQHGVRWCPVKVHVDGGGARVHLYAPTELLDQMDVRGLQEGLSRSALIVKAVRQYLAS